MKVQMIKSNRERLIALFVVFSLVVSSNTLLAQKNNWYIKISNGDILSSVSLQGLVGDSLAISHLGETNWIPVDSIVEMRKLRKSNFWKGVGIGVVAGAVTGALIGYALYELSPREGFDFGPVFSALAGGITGLPAGCLVGGVISSSGKEEIYYLTRRKHEQKLVLIRWILSKDR